MKPEKLALKLKAFFKKAEKQKAVVGVSGGVDSSLVLWLCIKALGQENVFAYHLPYKEGENEVLRQWVEKLGARYEIVSIRKAVDALISETGAKDRVAKGNIMARARMIFLYNFARQHDALVVGTGNKTELKVGYFTKHGDGATDVLPIGGLYKTEVWQMARKIGMPENIIEKTPTAGLWEGQTDEGELGLRYIELDEILKALADWKEKAKIAKRKFGEKKVNRVREMIRRAKHKLELAPVI